MISFAKPPVSVVIPCYNEEKHLPALMEDLLAQDYPTALLEVIFCDGASTDGTSAILESQAVLNTNFRVLNNARRYVPFGLNMAVKASSGEVVLRMDAHSRYPPDYISALVGHLLELNADNVGGVWDTRPGAGTLTAAAIAAAMASPFGIGNALYRTGTTGIREVDTVPYGCYRREVFNKIGLFDEELIRNQDDEFNARLRKQGGRIFLVPSVRITYYARESIGKMMKMFYQYGLFKPLVNRKIGAPATLRQLVPPTFVLTLLLLAAGSLLLPALTVLLAGVLVLHLLAGFLAGHKAAAKCVNPALRLLMPWIFLCIHLSYGWGYLEGIFRFLIFPGKSRTRNVGSTR